MVQIVGLNVPVIVEIDVHLDAVLVAEAHVVIRVIRRALMVVEDADPDAPEVVVRHARQDVLMIVIMHALKRVLALVAVR